MVFQEENERPFQSHAAAVKRYYLELFVSGVIYRRQMRFNFNGAIGMRSKQCEDAGLTKVEFLPSEIALDL